MAKRKQSKKNKDTLVDIVEVGGQAQDFFQKYQNLIIGVVAGLVLLIGGWFAYKNLYLLPKNNEAMEQMFQAQFQFERDSFVAALTNPGGGFEGFLDIIENYGGTQAANTAHYYAGISYLQLGQYDASIDFLTDFNPVGELTPIVKFGALGDAYSELNQMSKAVSNYKKAINSKVNDFLTPYYMLKLGLLMEKEGNLEEASTLYTKIKSDFPSAPSASSIDKYIARVNG